MIAIDTTKPAPVIKFGTEWEPDRESVAYLSIEHTYTKANGDTETYTSFSGITRDDAIAFRSVLDTIIKEN